MRKIILIGIPGCGKSTLGKRLAKELKMPFFDTDQLMINKIKPDSFIDFVAMAFNGQFINVQKLIINELAKRIGGAVISTSAEVALIPACAALIKSMGTVIHIHRKPEIILDTIDNKGFIRNSECIRLYMKEFSKFEALADLILENDGTEEEGLQNLSNLINCRIDNFSADNCQN